jgi:hypothetical protein
MCPLKHSLQLLDYFHHNTLHAIIRLRGVASIHCCKGIVVMLIMVSALELGVCKIALASIVSQLVPSSMSVVRRLSASYSQKGLRVQS